MAHKTQTVFLVVAISFGIFYCLTFNILLTPTSSITAVLSFLRQFLLPCSETRTNILIISYGRSGSSFLGQLFNQHPDVFYIYEPLKMIKATTLGSSNLYEESAIKLLHDILDCRFDEQEEFLNFLTSMHHHRFSSKALTLPFCKNTNNISASKKVYICRPLKSPETNRICSKYRHRVVKILTFRLPRLSVRFWKPFMKSKTKVKVLHLVRDPRSVVASMERVGWLFDSVGSPQQRFVFRVRKFCDFMIQTWEFILEAEKELREEYKLLRYEDLVRDVYGVSKDVFRFAGISISDSVNNWLKRNTNVQLKDTKALNYHYMTGRANITTLVDTWRVRLTRNQILVVEKYCWPAMKLFGYPAVFREQALFGLGNAL